jgi:hypothetical protein
MHFSSCTKNEGQPVMPSPQEEQYKKLKEFEIRMKDLQGKQLEKENKHQRRLREVVEEME